MKRGVGAALAIALLIGLVAAAAAGTTTTTTRYWWKGGHSKADIARIEAALTGVSGVTKVDVGKKNIAVTCDGAPVSIASLDAALTKAGAYSIGGQVTAARAHSRMRAARTTK